MVCKTTIKQVHRQDTVWEPRVYNLRKPKVLNTNLFSCFQYILQTKSGSNGQYENKVKRNCCQTGLVYCLFHYSIRLTTTTIKMWSFLYCIKTKKSCEARDIPKYTFFKDSREAVNCAHQVNFGILFYNFHVFFWIVAIPPIPLPIVVKHQLRLDMFIWSYVSPCKFCSNSPRSLENRVRLNFSPKYLKPCGNFI